MKLTLRQQSKFWYCFSLTLYLIFLIFNGIAFFVYENINWKMAFFATLTLPLAFLAHLITIIKTDKADHQC